MSEQLAEHLAGLRGRPRQGEVLPPHFPTCLGCGPDAEAGFHLQVRQDGPSSVHGRHVFLARHSGGPGVAHGGAVATVVDDVLGFLLQVEQVLGVTRWLELDYLAPVQLGVAYDVRAVLDRREGRKLFTSCTGTGPDGTVAFAGKALFIQVDAGHFAL